VRSEICDTLEDFFARWVRGGNLMPRDFGRLFAECQILIERAADNTWLVHLGVADDACLVDVFVG
jgi:hypothetical protein